MASLQRNVAGNSSTAMIFAAINLKRRWFSFAAFDYWRVIIPNAECSGNLKVPLTGWKYDDICNHMGDVRLLQEKSCLFEEVLGYHAQPIFKKNVVFPTPEAYFRCVSRNPRCMPYSDPMIPTASLQGLGSLRCDRAAVGGRKGSCHRGAPDLVDAFFFASNCRSLVFWLIFVYFFPKQCVHSRSLRSIAPNIAPVVPLALAWPKLSSTGVFFPSVYLHFTIELKQYSSSMKQWYNVAQYY